MISNRHSKIFATYSSINLVNIVKRVAIITPDSYDLYKYENTAKYTNICNDSDRMVLDISVLKSSLFQELFS